MVQIYTNLSSKSLRKRHLGIWFVYKCITGDNSLRVDEIGVPINLARSLQIPETVRSFNIHKLNTYFLNKRDKYPGCSGVFIKDTNHFHRIKHLDPNYV